MSNLADLSMTEAADAVRFGETTSVVLLEACWQRMEALNPLLNATIWTDRDAAMAFARAADAAVRGKAKLGVLHGVPMMHKDMYYQAGKLSTCGSALRCDWGPSVPATGIVWLAAPWAYTFGRVYMDEIEEDPTC